MDQMKTVQSMDKTQEEMWHEFRNHFKDNNRATGKAVNHHDFLDASFLPKVGKSQSRRTFFSQVGGLSMDRHPYGAEERESAVDLGRERLANTRKLYAQLQSQSYEIPLNKEKAGVPKWL